MTRRKTLRNQLYQATRDLGNIQAANDGPASYWKRVVRRQEYRSTNRTLAKVLKGFGL